MQAHPLSSPAARITSTSRPTLSNTSRPAAIPTPSLAGTVGLAHDAGNLLAAIGLYCDLLSVPGVLRPEHKHYATELSLISSRSSTLIRRLLATPSATPPASPMPDTPAPLPGPSTAISPQNEHLSDAANHASVLRNLTPVLQMIAARTARVTVTCPTSLPPLYFTSDILERITVNLVRNAAEALRIQRRRTDSPKHPQRGEIRVSLAVVGPQFQLTVEDNGPGMPLSIAAKFLRPSPLPQGATHGLGHRIIHELATATGAQLAIRVLPGNGTVFSILWPIPAPLHHDPPCIDAPHSNPSSAPQSNRQQTPHKEQALANS